MPTQKPPDALDCYYLEPQELLQALETRSRLCQYDPADYFFITGNPNPTTIVGWLGRADYSPSYFERQYSNLTYFRDYTDRKTGCFTFDKTTLYRIVTILPERPLKFILEQVQDFSKLCSMINQEEIYQLLHKKQWAGILHILHQNKSRIAGDELLLQSAKMFEDEFSKTIAEHPIEDAGLTDHIEKLWMLHKGNFFSLKPETYKLLVVQLAKRKSGEQGYNFALEFPEEKETKEIIKKYRGDNPAATRPAVVKFTERVWVEIYNRVFELINQQENSATYFSGHRFITLIKEFDPYFPDYRRYIDLRNQEGKSTSRKIFYYDILMEQPESLRIQIIQRILAQVSSHEPLKVQAIEMLLGLKSREDKVINETKAVQVPVGTRIVFISYTWDDPEHEAWVLRLANRLRSNGVEVLLDKYDLKAGKSIPHFAEQSIKNAHKVLVIFTPKYKTKAERRTGGAGYEYSIINAALYADQTGNEKIIPVLRKGTQQESIPEFMRQYIHLDLRNDDTFETSFTDLLKEIFDEPIIKKPALGPRPDFD